MTIDMMIGCGYLKELKIGYLVGIMVGYLVEED